MKILKKEEGITGIDITIAIILITIFISIIATLFYNIQKTSTELERETIATSYAVEIIEEIKALGFGQLPNVDEGTNQITGYEDKYIEDNGKDTPYYQTIRVEDYSEINESEEIEPDMVKKVTVTISYKVNNKDKDITLSTLMSINT